MKAELKAFQLSDSLISTKLDSTPPKWEDVSHMNLEFKVYWSEWDRLVLEDDILYTIWTDTNIDMFIAQVVLPFSLRQEVFDLLHAAPSAGNW